MLSIKEKEKISFTVVPHAGDAEVLTSLMGGIFPVAHIVCSKARPHF
jgi:tripartite-type tricarboxylate transporter receptor subunit TctC